MLWIKPIYHPSAFIIICYKYTLLQILKNKTNFKIKLKTDFH